MPNNEGKILEKLTDTFITSLEKSKKVKGKLLKSIYIYLIVMNSVDKGVENMIY